MPSSPIDSHYASSPEVYSVIREVLHEIGDIDYQHEAEIHKANKNSSDEEVKNYIKQKIQAAYQKRRQPYIDLLNALLARQPR